jgi:hypothetical protein
MGVMTAARRAAIPTGRPGHQELAFGDEPVDAERPFPVRIVPARLRDGLRP